MIAKLVDVVLAALLVVVMIAASFVALAALGAAIGIPVATAAWIIRQAF